VHADPCSQLPFFQYRQIVFLDTLGSMSPEGWRLVALGTELGSDFAFANCCSTGGDSGSTSGAAVASGADAASAAAAEDVALP
jgi:hypothetical protein